MNRLSRAIAALLGITTAQAQEAPQVTETRPACRATVGLFYHQIYPGREELLETLRSGRLPNIPGIDARALTVSDDCQEGVRALGLLVTRQATTSHRYLSLLLGGGTDRVGGLFRRIDAREALANLRRTTDGQTASLEGAQPVMRCSAGTDPRTNRVRRFLFTSRDRTLAGRHAQRLGITGPLSCSDLN